MGLACVVFSYNGCITMTLIADAGIVPDVADLARHLEESYAILRKAAKVDPLGTPPAPEKKAEQPESSAQPAKAMDAGYPSPALSSSTTREQKLHPNDKPDVEPAATPLPSVDAVANSTVPAVYYSSNGTGRLKLFSEEWASAYREAINQNQAYRSASRGWEAGAVAFILRAAPERGYPNAAAVLLDLHRGECRAAHSRSYRQAITESAFALEGNYDTWLKLLRGEASPVAMLMSGSLKLRKGSLTRLAPYAESAQELLNSAQLVYVNAL
jgi:putative sterol carrier protein